MTLTSILMLALSFSTAPIFAVEAAVDDATAWAAWVKDRDEKIRTGAFSFVSASDVQFVTEPKVFYVEDGVPAAKQKLTATKPAKAVMTIEYDGKNASIMLADGKKQELLGPGITDKKFETGLAVNLRASRSERDGRAAFRLFDIQHPAKTGFKGLSYYPFHKDAKVEAEFVYDPQPKIIEFETVQSLITRLYRVGKVKFIYRGKPVEMDAYADESDPLKAKELSFFFKDASNGKATYSGGRYLDIEVSAPLNELTTVKLDLNRAYNPLCARSKYWNCVRVPGKAIPVAIEAGEKAPQKLKGSS